MLGMPLSEYQEECKNVKISKSKKIRKVKPSKKFLASLGLTENDLLGKNSN